MAIELVDLIYRKKNALTKDEAYFLIEEYQRLDNTHQLEHCPHAITGIDTFSSFKRVELTQGTEAFDLVFKANENLINEYLDYLDGFEMFHTLIRTTMTYSHMYRLLKYEKGAKIHPHTDHSPFIYGSATFNLNDNYTGGDFVFWRGKHRVKLEACEAMIWPADHFWIHEVEEITSGVRYSTNSFLQSVADPLREAAMNFVEKKIEQSKLIPIQREYEKTHRYKIKKPQTNN
jgi:hypothetical protein